MELRINFQGMSFRFGIILCACVRVCVCVFGIANSLRYNGFMFALLPQSPWGLGYKNTPEFIMPKRVIRQRRRNIPRSKHTHKKRGVSKKNR